MTADAVLQKKKVNWAERCQHNKFLVDEQLGYVECGICGEHLNPIWVIGQLSNREARARRYLEALKEQAEKASKKNRCKCEKCGEMTRIVR